MIYCELQLEEPLRCFIFSIHQLYEFTEYGKTELLDDSYSGLV